MSRKDLYPEPPGIMSLDHALYRAGRDYRGGITALALEVGMNHNTLAHKLNPDKPTHVLTLPELLAIIQATKDDRIIDALAHASGAIAVTPRPVGSVKDRLTTTASLQRHMADFTEALVPFLINTPSPDSLARLEKEGYRLVSCLVGTLVGVHLANGMTLEQAKSSLQKALVAEEHVACE